MQHVGAVHELEAAQDLHSVKHGKSGGARGCIDGARCACLCSEDVL